MCGIYGIINKDPETLDYATFCCLGLANDLRGGDSCGIFFDGKTEYGIKETARFEDFFWESELLNNAGKVQIAIGHDRKASVGGISLAKAHPIIINDQDGNPKFVLVHNGTIHNYLDLAKEFIPEIDCKDFSDSQVLALILYHKGFDVLSKYMGGTAFCCVHYQEGKPIVFLYKGASKLSRSSKEETEERPLYLAYSPETGELVFSSILSFLFVQRDNTSLMKKNVVYKYEDGVLEEYKIIDRSNCVQTKAKEEKPKSEPKVVRPEKVAKANVIYKGSDSEEEDEYIYLAKDHVNNLYNFGGKPLHGKYIISTFGRIIEDCFGRKLPAGMYPIYFYQGIPLVSSEIFGYLEHLCKKSIFNTPEEFAAWYQNLIRYYSLDRVYNDQGVYYIATAVDDRKPFTGLLQMIGLAQGLCIKNGYSTHEFHNGQPYESIYKRLYPNLDYKKVWKQLKQYTLSQERHSVRG